MVRARAAALLAAASAALLTACGGSALAVAELQADGLPPAELRQCPAVADAGAACPADCPDLKAQLGWNSADAGTGAVAALVELDGEQVLFSDHGATVFLGGVPYASDPTVTAWRGAGRIPGPDGTGDWAVGISGDGALLRVSGAGLLAPVSDRFGLAQEKVVALAATGGPGVAFALESGLAVSDGAVVRRYDVQPRALAGGGGKVAWTETGAVRRLDPSSGAVDGWRLAGAQAVALSASGRLIAATAHGLWAESPTASLVQLYQTPSDVHGLVATGERFWFAQGQQLGYLEGNQVVRTAPGALLTDSTAPLFVAEGSGVWSLTAGQPRRWSAGGQLALWQQLVLPAFSRVCSACHLPAGTAGIPLASLGDWQAKRAQIQQRVFDAASDKPMPPANSTTTLTAGEKASLLCWLGTQQ
jgi:hypothetical protein